MRPTTATAATATTAAAAGPGSCAHLGNRQELHSRLAAISARNRTQFLSVALQVAGQTLLAEVDATGVPRAIEAQHATRVPAGCLTKPLTASLLAECVAAGQVDWNTEIAEILDFPGPAKHPLSGIRLGHLLDHTHGLDCLRVDEVPRTSAGFVDVAELCGQLALRPLSEPGELYSYGNTGAWLGGAILEKIHGQQYTALLTESPILPADSAGGRTPFPRICPATGDTLELTPAQWLSFLALQMRPLPHLAPLLTRRVTLPGWSPAEQAACLGWKDYGDGWYGHNANMTSHSALLRFNPRAGIALAVAGANDAAFFTLAGLFGTALPELANLRIPRLRVKKADEVFQTDPYIGSFSLGATHIQVTAELPDRLAFTFQSRNPADRRIEGRLRPADNNVFYPDCQAPGLPFLQFVRSRYSQDFNYLWNGKQLWRRVSSRSHSVS